ncbi:MAG: hypothetical protein ACE5JB_13580, partial [bacterium]
MLKNLIFSILFIGGMNFSIGHSSLYGSILQEEVKANDNISSLLNLVGQKCTVFLKNGDGKYGTLWELGEDFIILKIKKGPLYSKEEKFAISEIKFLEDSDGNKIEIKNIKANESKAEYFKDSKTEESYIPLETVLKNSNEKESGQKDNRLNQSSISLQSKSSKSTQELSFKSNGSKKTEPTNPGLVVVSRPSKNTKKNTRGIKQSLNKKQKTVQNAKAKTKTAETEIQQQPIASKEVVETVTPETKKIRILKYQTAILFSATLMAFTFIFFLKIKGMKGYTY